MLRDPAQPDFRIALLTDFTPDFLAGALREGGQAGNLGLSIHTVSPHALEAEVMDQDSPLYAFQPTLVILGLSGPMQWTAFESLPPGTERLRFAGTLLERCVRIWQTLQSRIPGLQIWQSNLGPFPDGLSGMESPRHPTAFAFHQKQFNEHLMEELVAHRGISLLDWVDPVVRIGTLSAYDARLWQAASHPYALEFLTQLVSPLVKRLKWQVGRFLKVVVIDLDETLWGGVVGDRGPHGIHLGQEGLGNVYRTFQLWLRHLKSDGILLAVASKNEAPNAREPFTVNPENVLQLDDFASFQTGWMPKSEMIRRISEELNIGLDAFCFMDDNPFEREEVRTRLPEVTVPDLPRDPAEWIPYLAGTGLFEGGDPSTADNHRTRWILDENQRKATRQGFISYEAYLASLGMEGRMEPMLEIHLARAHQLLMRTNQFNLRTGRHRPEQLEEMIHSNEWGSWIFGLKDKFGDYGTISLVLLQLPKDEPGKAFINTWLMSCRVFGRGMEKWILRKLTDHLVQTGHTLLEGEFIPSPKNHRFSTLYQDLGFSPTPSGRWCLDLKDLPVHETLITDVDSANDA